MRRRALLAGVASLSSLYSGCSMPQFNSKTFNLGEIQIENQETAPQRVTVAVTKRSEVVFLDSVTASPAEWNDDDLVRQGGAVFENVVSEQGRYTVSVRVGDGSVQTIRLADIAEDGGCVSVRPNIERGGGFHFEYADCSEV